MCCPAARPPLLILLRVSPPPGFSNGVDWKALVKSCIPNITALHEWGGAHQTSNHLPKPNL